jgi:hypothetical protein
MIKFFGVIGLIMFMGCTTSPGRVSEGNNQESAIFSDSGTVSFQNDEYFFAGTLVNDLQKTLEIWSIPDSQGFPKLTSITKIRRNESISLFLVYATNKDIVNMTYDLRTLRPDGTFSNNAYKGLEILEVIHKV